jgi:hypothetical protein
MPKHFISSVFRPGQEKADIAFLILATLVGGGAGYVVTGLAPYIGPAFTVIAILFLFLTWRSPKKRQAS